MYCIKGKLSSCLRGKGFNKSNQGQQDISQLYEVKRGESHGPYVTARTANQDGQTSKIENRLTTGVIQRVVKNQDIFTTS